ncbi:hemin ABC transporter substrate-binding protein [Pseudactinotalea sp. HY158]|uniref:heme/hemin ABC transporter substrate-binding protein n=1 Tax=Pseudactinotalea sp. HY158 TaxID=2654547 RepID=UPI00129C3CA4|nr:ABC transporter substrate-binding protein [Pseudactinotalea sp. HY158]QGH68631.1 ABC transporter substrate-binding protein [Pseudactinotalea sp. HY158]
MKRSRIAAATIAALAMLAAGCSAPATGGDPAATATTGATAATPTGAATEGEDAGEPGAVVNALDLTGPAHAADVPDMEPVVTRARPSLPVTITDAAGEQVTIEKADRLLSLDLYGTLTDTVIGLGLGDSLVGRANSDLQASLADLPVVTRGGHDLNVEAILGLEPDLILTNTTIGTAAAYSQLEAGGVTVVRFEQIPTFEGIATTIEAVGAAVGMAVEATTLAEDTQDRLTVALERVEELAAGTPRPPRGLVLYVRGTAGVFFILGAEYGAADILGALGLADVAGENGIDNLRPANAESLVSLDPEIVLAMDDGVESSGGIDGFLDRPGMAATTAGMNERVVTAADSQLLAYGPRTPENLVALAEAIYTGGDAS